MKHTQAATGCPNLTRPRVSTSQNLAKWPEWKQRFTRFRTATKLNGESDEVQICSLVYAMGAEAETVIKSFVYAEEGDDKKYPKVLKPFDDYFVPLLVCCLYKEVYLQIFKRVSF